FWVVAASWGVIDRLGFSPLDYEPIIILLTVVHFHYAGYLLLQLYLLSLPHWNKKYGKVVGVLLLLGMPMVAVGISSTQIGWPGIIESLSVTVMASGGMGVGFGYLFLAWKFRGDVGALLWFVAGLCLIGGLTLAFLYGWRFQTELPWLSIPWMYAVHGTLNSVGFALFGLLGWRSSQINKSKASR
ncbi:MAG: YndJ family transporter, partial [Saprospiraceae bacterium]